MNVNDLFVELVKEKFDDSLKYDVLVAIDKDYVSLSRLAKYLKCSMPLLCYHLNGNSKSKGLVEFGLVDKVFNKNKTVFYFKVTDLGKDVLKIMKR